MGEYIIGDKTTYNNIANKNISAHIFTFFYEIIGHILRLGNLFKDYFGIYLI